MTKIGRDIKVSPEPRAAEINMQEEQSSGMSAVLQRVYAPQVPNVLNMIFEGLSESLTGQTQTLLCNKDNSFPLPREDYSSLFYYTFWPLSSTPKKVLLSKEHFSQIGKLSRESQS